MNATTTKRWIAGFVMMAGLGTAIIGGSAVAAAETGTATNTTGSNALGTSAGPTVGPVNDGASSRQLVEQVGVKIQKPRKIPHDYQAPGYDPAEQFDR